VEIATTNLSDIVRSERARSERKNDTKTAKKSKSKVSLTTAEATFYWWFKLVPNVAGDL